MTEATDTKVLVEVSKEGQKKKIKVKRKWRRAYQQEVNGAASIRT